MAVLNRSSPLPLYAQLAQQVEARILAGAYKEGSSIPSEHSLCDEFSVGRPTVRQATDELVRKGLVERRRGSGTFVRERRDAIDLFSLGGTIRSFEEKGVALQTRLLSQPTIETQSNGASGFVFKRLGHVQETPILLEEFWFDASVFANLDSVGLDGQSLSSVVQGEYGLSPLTADQVFSAVELSSSQAQLLQVRPRSAALLVERHLHFSIAKDAVIVRMLCKQNQHYTFFQTIGGSVA